MTDFDVVIHKRATLGHSHTASQKGSKDAQFCYYIGIYVRPGDSPMHTLKSAFGLRQGPNPISCHWIGEVWEDYASLKVTAPSTILLDRTPVTTIAGFETPGVEIAVILQALIQDNPTFPLYDVAYIWVEKMDIRLCSLHIVWKLRYHSVSVGNQLRHLNNQIDAIISISAQDNPNMIAVRTSIAESLAHFRLTNETAVCDWNNPRTRQQWAQISEKYLRPTTKINPLRLQESTLPTVPQDVTSTALPCSALVVTENNFPKLAPSSAITRASHLTLVPQLQESYIKEVIAQALSKEIDQFNSTTQKLGEQLSAIEKEQAAARERDSLTIAMIKENREANEKMILEAREANRQTMQESREASMKLAAAMERLAQFSHPPTSFNAGVIPPAPQPPFKRREIETSSAPATRSSVKPRQVGSIPMEQVDTVQSIAVKGPPADPPDRSHSTHE